MEEYTVEEVRQQFIDYIKAMISYIIRDERQPTIEDKLNLLAFTILVGIDGECADLPAFVLAPSPHPDDKKENISNGEKYYAEIDPNHIKCDIAGDLHNRLNKRR